MISSVQHLLPQAGVTADTAPTHKGKERLGTIGKWDMQSTWMVSASFKGEGKATPPPKQTSVRFVASSFQPAKITADVTSAPRGPWPSLRITEPMTPVGCPEHKHTSSLSQGHGRSSSLLCWTCLPRGLKAWPSLPSHPKSSFSLTPCLCSSSPVLVLLPGLLVLSCHSSSLARNGGSRRAALL